MMLSSRISRVSGTITRRSLTTTAAAAAATPPRRRLVISRRVWQAHEKTLPKAKPKPKADSSDEKPWPQSVRIAGAVVGGIFIPYSILWFITSNPSLRERLENYLPMDKLRTHFGEVEHGGQSYVDAQMDKEAKVFGQEAGLYIFPGEITWKDRKQQELVAKMEASQVTANLYVLEDHAELKQTKQVPASKRANRKVLSELVGTSEDPNVAVAVDFEDEDADYADAMMEDDNNMGSSFAEEHIDHNPIQPLLQQTHTFSNWYYHSNVAAQQAQEQQASNNTDTQMEQSRLEYTISELEKNLKDINCTRDIDDMMTELRQSQRDLSRLKWKRRLGI